MAERIAVSTVSKVFRVMRTVGEMCKDRGYIVPPDWCCESMDDFRARFVPDDRNILRDRMLLLCGRQDTGDTLLVFFNGEDSVNNDRLRDYQQKAIEQTVKQIILVVAGKLNPIAKRQVELSARSRDQVRIQVFSEDDLVVNITHHELVPKHTPLTSIEAAEMLQAHSLELAMLPRILSTDPIVLYFGLEKGRVMKITRRSETAGEYITYRQVI